MVIYPPPRIKMGEGMTSIEVVLLADCIEPIVDGRILGMPRHHLGLAADFRPHCWNTEINATSRRCRPAIRPRRRDLPPAGLLFSSPRAPESYLQTEFRCR